VTGPDTREPCPRCAPQIAELGEQIAELHARLQFRPCGYAALGAARCEVRAPGGRVTRGRLCAAHLVLLSASPAFGVAVLNEEDGACQWLVPSEESSMAEDGEAAPGGAAARQEATA
jgi:hypothetical protein